MNGKLSAACGRKASSGSIRSLPYAAGGRLAWACLVPITVTVALMPGPTALGQDAPQSLGGQIDKLPGADSREQRGELLGGHVHLLAKSMDQAIEDLQHARLKQFVGSYKNMVESYSQLGDHVGAATSSIGDAETRLMLADRRLQGIGDQPTTDPRARQKLEEDIGQIRAMLLGRLRAARARYEHVASDEKTDVLRQMHALVSRVKQLDGLAASISNGTKPILPGLAAGELGGHIEALRESLDEEERLLGVVAQSVRLLVDATTAEMKRTIRLLEVEASIPREVFSELAETRNAMQQILRGVRAAHRRASESATQILIENSPDDPPPRDADVLGEADRLLGMSDL